MEELHPEEEESMASVHLLPAPKWLRIEGGRTPIEDASLGFKLHFTDDDLIYSSKPLEQARIPKSY